MTLAKGSLTVSLWHTHAVDWYWVGLIDMTSETNCQMETNQCQLIERLFTILERNEEQ